MSTKEELIAAEEHLLRKHKHWESFKPYAGEPRLKDDIDRDLRFLQAYYDATRNESAPKLALELLAHKGGALGAWTGDKYLSVKLPAGLYKREDVSAALASGEKPSHYSYDGLLYSVYQKGMYRGGSPTTKDRLSFMMLDNGEYVGIEGIGVYEDNEIPLVMGGLVYKIVDGQLVLQRTLNTAEFEKHYPQIASHGVPHGYYYSALLAKETSPMWDQAPAVLEEFRARLKLYPSAEILAIVPVWIRTWGMSPESNGNTKRDFYRIVRAPYAQSVLLRDEMAWQVHFKLNGKIVPGVAHFTGPEDGCRLAISDWCYRETPEGAAESEMFHGHHNKLDILAWMAGPASDRFASERNNKFKFVPAFKHVKKQYGALWDAMLNLLDMSTPVNSVEELNSILEKTDGKGYIIQANLLYNVKGPAVVGPYGPSIFLERYFQRDSGNTPYNNKCNFALPCVVVPPSLAELVYPAPAKPAAQPATAEAK